MLCATEHLLGIACKYPLWRLVGAVTGVSASAWQADRGDERPTTLSGKCTTAAAQPRTLPSSPLPSARLVRETPSSAARCAGECACALLRTRRSAHVRTCETSITELWAGRHGTEWRRNASRLVHYHVHSYLWHYWLHGMGPMQENTRILSW
jgi:hypothetical protein